MQKRASWGNWLVQSHTWIRCQSPNNSHFSLFSSLLPCLSVLRNSREWEIKVCVRKGSASGGAQRLALYPRQQGRLGLCIISTLKQHHVSMSYVTNCSQHQHSSRMVPVPLFTKTLSEEQWKWKFLKFFWWFAEKSLSFMICCPWAKWTLKKLIIETVLPFPGIFRFHLWWY